MWTVKIFHKIGCKRRRRNLRLRDVFPCSREGKLTMFYPPEAFQLVGDGLEPFHFPFQNQHLEAVIMIKVNVNRGDDVLVVVVLNLGEFFGKFPAVMFEDHARHADDFIMILGPFLLHQAIPDEVSDGLRAVQVSFFSDFLVELGEEFLVDRNSESGNFRH